MLFYSVEKNLVVNSKKTKKTIARFENGKFKTDDPVLIEKLKGRFKYKENTMVTFNRLRDEAIKKGINTHKMKKREIEKALEGYNAKSI